MWYGTNGAQAAFKHGSGRLDGSPKKTSAIPVEGRELLIDDHSTYGPHDEDPTLPVGMLCWSVRSASLIFDSHDGPTHWIVTDRSRRVELDD
ncbi:hypothetical protein PGTUg99_019244 [Puccinia graminis f. sp. tritici]|uniref:Uncharacterized protein n=1 Tax=Puccinia graminis f. sp. tritici TaxID=56615 RepID=A0A5B0LPJ0_PUCGR|nr:hypothetical protein PGTUg99_019244 [Puccinia graminis f. sp. tritici]